MIASAAILQVNKFFWPKGGADQHFLELIGLLADHGQYVIPFSMQLAGGELRTLELKQRELYEAHKKWFVSYLDFSDKSTLFEQLRRMIWSREARQQLSGLLNHYRSLGVVPRVAHIHNIYHQLSPSIFAALEDRKIPTVMTVHDFGIFDTSLATSFAERIGWATELLFHQSIYKRHIDRYIAPSMYVQQRLEAAGIAAEKVRIIPHFLELTSTQRNQYVKLEKHQQIVYVGRLSKEKGVDIALQAFIQSDYDGSLCIIGDGPMRNELEAAAKRASHQRGSKSIRFTGFLNKEAVYREVAQSELSVFPSRIPETFGLGAAESLLLGTPVVAPALGAFPELIRNGVDGMLLSAHPSIREYAMAFTNLTLDQRTLDQMSDKAQQTSCVLTKEQYYEKLMEVYKEL